jgi:hypothetical protein
VKVTLNARYNFFSVRIGIKILLITYAAFIFVFIL